MPQPFAKLLHREAPGLDEVWCPLGAKCGERIHLVMTILRYIDPVVLAKIITVVPGEADVRNGSGDME